MSMIPSYEQRFARYEQSPEEVRELYTSPGTGKIMRSVFDKYALQESQYIDYAAIIGAVILGFSPKGQLAGLLAQEADIPRETADAIANDLADLLAPLPDKVRDPGERLELMPEGAELGKQAEKEGDGGAAPISKDELLGSLKARRTMAGDMEEAKQRGSEGGSAVEEKDVPARPAVAPGPAPEQTSASPEVKEEQSKNDAEEQKLSPPESEGAGDRGGVPRYAKPLTDLPKYDNDSRT